jgi:hypothetical protein
MQSIRALAGYEQGKDKEFIKALVSATKDAYRENAPGAVPTVRTHERFGPTLVCYTLFWNIP